uniref:DUF6973 domain-containing protein n=1 Tax=Nocardia suismassiliense TaxID=2077092 RepID=UPI003F49A6A5
MAAWVEIKQWKPNIIGQVGDHLIEQKKLVVGLEDELDGAKAAGWAGPAAETAANNLRDRRQALEEFAARLSAAVKIIDETEQYVRDLVLSVMATEDLATKNGYRIENGTVVATEHASGFFTDAMLRMEVQDVLDNAARIDTLLNSVLRRILSGEINDAGAATLATAAEAGEDRVADEQRHRELLAKYQVKTDGTTIWPTGLTAAIAEKAGFKQQRITEAEAAMMNSLQLRKGLLGLKEFADIRQDAIHLAEVRFNKQGLSDGHADAFRHAYWNALLTKRYGEKWASEFATAHERNPTSHHIPVAMDLHNNEVGRQIARANPNASAEQLANLAAQAVEDGRMVVIDRNNTLVPSNELTRSQTREIENNPWPSTNPGRDDDPDPGRPTAKPDQY